MDEELGETVIFSPIGRQYCSEIIPNVGFDFDGLLIDCLAYADV